VLASHIAIRRDEVFLKTVTMNSPLWGAGKMGLPTGEREREQNPFEDGIIMKGGMLWIGWARLSGERIAFRNVGGKD